MLTPGAMSEADYLAGRYQQQADLARKEREFWEAKDRGYYVGNHGWKVDVHPGDRPPSDSQRTPGLTGREAHQLDQMAGIKYCQQVTCVCGKVTGWRWVLCTPEGLNSPAYCDDCQPPPEDTEPVTPAPTPVTPPHCQHCGHPLTHPQAKYCTPACRQAAYRARHQASTSPPSRQPRNRDTGTKAEKLSPSFSAKIPPAPHTPAARSGPTPTARRRGHATSHLSEAAARRRADAQGPQGGRT